LKNLNSFKHVEKAIRYEIRRQKEVILDGEKVVQETRLWDPDRNTTTSMRGKEEAHDYRYFPDPDLLPLVLDDQWIESVGAGLPELPDEKSRRFMQQYGLPAHDAGLLTSDRELADYFEACVNDFPDAKQVSNWIMGSLLGLLKARGKTIEASPISARNLSQLLVLINKGTISGKIAKSVFEEMAQTGNPPESIVEEQGLVQITDSDVIETAVSEVISAHPDEVQAYRQGKTKLLGFFVGQIMKETRGKANPKLVNELLKKMLDA
jgi:aspartyl-tRNA(Asn)/glutamyl-tRNA(Gln) amidotransferase subunit B